MDEEKTERLTKDQAEKLVKSMSEKQIMEFLKALRFCPCCGGEQGMINE